MFYKRRLHINKVESRMTDGQKDSQGSRLHHQQCYQDRFMIAHKNESNRPPFRTKKNVMRNAMRNFFLKV